MKSSVQRIFILDTAIAAHLEIAHRRPLAVIRNAFDNRKTRSAIGAVDKRIAIATIFRVEHLAQTIGAGGDVGGPQSAQAVGSA